MMATEKLSVEASRHIRSAKPGLRRVPGAGCPGRRIAVFTPAVIRLSARVSQRAIPFSVSHAVGTNATRPNSSR